MTGSVAAGRPVSVRRGSSEDFEAVSALYVAVAAEGQWIGAEAPVELTEQRRRAWCEVADDEARGAWFLAEDAAQVGDARLAGAPTVVGYLSVMLSGSEHAEFAMAVAATHRGQGVGGMLLDEAVGWCRAKTISKISCQVWPHNAAALGLYASRGFLVEGRLRRHWRRRNGQLWDAMVMALALDEKSAGSDLPDAVLPGLDLLRWYGA